MEAAAEAATAAGSLASSLAPLTPHSPGGVLHVTSTATSSFLDGERDQLPKDSSSSFSPPSRREEWEGQERPRTHYILQQSAHGSNFRRGEAARVYVFVRWGGDDKTMIHLRRKAALVSRQIACQSAVRATQPQPPQQLRWECRCSHFTASVPPAVVKIPPKKSETRRREQKQAADCFRPPLPECGGSWRGCCGGGGGCLPRSF